MKNIVLFFLLFCAGSLMAQSNGPAHVIKTNPLGLLLGQYQLGYEHALSDKFSVQMSAGMIVGELTAYDSTSFEFVTASRSGFIVIPEVRFYPGKKACEGFYLAAVARFRSESVDISEIPFYTRNATGAALVFGYQYYGDGVMVDVFLGPQFKQVDTKWFDESISEEEPLFNGGNGVRFGVNVGFGWTDN
ncbi:MAG: DUF3575 domain-containing protein [Flavobacteriales bacterium]|jgi:hypothetical protein